MKRRNFELGIRIATRLVHVVGLAFMKVGGIQRQERRTRKRDSRRLNCKIEMVAQY